MRSVQEKYLADPKSGPCPFFKPGDTFLLKRTPQQDDFYHLMNGKFCGEAPNKFRSGISFGRGQPVCVHSPSRGIHHERAEFLSVTRATICFSPLMHAVRWAAPIIKSANYPVQLDSAPGRVI